MRNKSDLATLSMDDLYNNLKVYKAEIKGQSSSISNSQNVAFVSLENTSITNEVVNTAHEVSIASSQEQASSSTYADDVMFSFFANQSNSPQLDNEDLEQIDTDDLEEIDLKWQVAILTMRVECYNYHRRGFFARECRAPRNQGNRNGDALRKIVPVETPTNALVVQDGICDDSVYKTKVSKNETSISKTSKDILEKPKTVRPSAPIIEDWDIDSDNDSVFRPKPDQTKPKFTKINVKTINKENTHRQEEYPRKSQSPRDNRRNWNGMMSQKLGNGFEFIKKACFVFITKSGQVPVNTAKQSSPRAATSISTARPVNTAAPKSKVNDV
ncbi:hypothetical protein Tco_0404544 [Tanacetum coccineum]